MARNALNWTFMHVSFSNGTLGRFLGRYWGCFSGQKNSIELRPRIYPIFTLFPHQIERAEGIDVDRDVLGGQLVGRGVHDEERLKQSDQKVLNCDQDSFVL